MYNTDAKILRQVCHLITDITKKYDLTDEEIFTISSAKAVLAKLYKKIEGKPDGQ